MRLYDFNKFNESSEEYNKYIKYMCYVHVIKKYTINDDGVVDIHQDVHFGNAQNNPISKLPFKIGKVDGNFTISNKITTLEGCPSIVERNFSCLETRLTNLIGSPNFVGNDFSIHENKLNSLEGCTKIIRGNFFCIKNKNLTSLIGGPEAVNKSYICPGNKLIDVRGFPEMYRGQVNIYNNPVEEIIRLFKGVDNDIIIETLNDYNVIRKGKVDLQLLKYAFDALEIPMPEIKYIEGYEII